MELLRRRRARRSLLDFTKYTMEDYRDNWHHRIVAEALDRVAMGQCRRLMIFMPPRSGKSELVSRHLPALLLGRNPKLKIIACSHTSDLAEDMNIDCQRIIESEPYQRLFPGTRLARVGSRRAEGGARRQSDFFETVDHRGYLLSAGVGQGIAGRGADCGIADDLFGKWEDAASPTIRQNKWEWWCKDFLSRLAKGAPVVLTHTRWHQDDVAGRELKTGLPWEVISLPAISEPRDNRHPEDRRTDGEALWPERQPLVELLDVRNSDLSGFDALYQQNPRGSGLVEWGNEYFKGMFYSELPPDLAVRLVVVACDPSKGSKSKTGDYSAVLKMILDRQGTLWIDDAWMRPCPMEECVRQFGATIIRDRPHAAVIETALGAELAIQLAQRCLDEQDCRVPLYPYSSNTNKNVRIRCEPGLSSWITTGRLRVRDCPGGRVGMDQLQEFPNAEHDDFCDAANIGISLMDELLA